MLQKPPHQQIKPRILRPHNPRAQPIEIPRRRHLIPSMIRQLPIKQRSSIPLNLALPMLRLLLAQRLMHPSNMAPCPSRPEKRTRRQGTHIIWLPARQLLGKQDASVVPFAMRFPHHILVQPIVYKGAVFARRNDGITHAPSVAAFVA